MARIYSMTKPITSLILMMLVEDGVSNCVIVAPSSLNDLQRLAIDDFRQTILRASGAEIRVFNAAEVAELSESTVRFLLDPDVAANCLGLTTDDLKEEEW